MRCKKHYTDLSSINGVCATCLRQRLFILIQQQSQSQSQSQTLDETVFPRSVSPYISRNGTRQHSVPDHRFFSTPQVGPTVGVGDYYNNNENNDNNNNKKKLNKKKKKNSFIKFSLLTNLFRSKKTEFGSDPNSDQPRVSNSVTGESATSSSSSPSWFSIKSRRNKHKQQQPVVNGVVRKQFCPDHGMSPARYSDCDSGYESCDSRKQTPWRTPARRVNSTAGSGLTFCLSPLVRASPCRSWNQKTPPVATVMTAVDGGGDVRPHLLNAKSFCANRSRKLADFGRLNPNR